MSLQMERIEKILEGSNENQRYAATREKGKYLLLAGAGSGKSHVVVNRIAYLIEKGVNPWEIVGISFTNKASNELTERLVKKIGQGAEEINTGTFHSLCTRILLRHQAALNIENLTILSDDDVEKTIKEIAESYGFLKDSLYDIRSFINYCGNEGIYPEDYEVYDVYSKFPRDFINIHEEYTTYKRHTGYVDFDDLLGLTYKLFNARPDILESYAKQWKYFLIDEAQDLSHLQFKISKQLSSYHNNIMYVGDENQSIYGFRGAAVQSFIDLEQDPDFEVIKLERNYRSKNNIIKASNSVIENNQERLDKVSYTENETGLPVFIYEATDDLREAEFVIKMMKGLHEQGYKYEDMMVLYRNHYMSQNISLSLSSAGIPYEVQQGVNFYDREEIKTIVSYLRIVENPLDNLALEYIINRPKRGIGPATINKLKMYASDIELPLSSVLEHVADIPKVNKPSQKNILELDALIKGIKQEVESTDKMVDIIKYIITKSKMMAEYDVEKTKDLQSIELIAELYNIAAKFDERGVTNVESSQSLLTQFLTETALYSSPEKEDTGKVLLSTVHSVKGLESLVVFVIGMQQGTFPSYQAVNSQNIEEERRLFYVAMTRAEDLLFISHNQMEYKYGRVEKATKSIFLDEIDKRYVKELGK